MKVTLPSKLVSNLAASLASVGHAFDFGSCTSSLADFTLNFWLGLRSSVLATGGGKCSGGSLIPDGRALHSTSNGTRVNASRVSSLPMRSAVTSISILLLKFPFKRVSMFLFALALGELLQAPTAATATVPRLPVEISNSRSTITRSFFGSPTPVLNSDMSTISLRCFSTKDPTSPFFIFMSM
jgi:hypothetical protein